MHSKKNQTALNPNYIEDEGLDYEIEILYSQQKIIKDKNTTLHTDIKEQMPEEASYKEAS